ncbi:MAG: SDR family oxidoreductase [Candidatus Rokuibacteriota bacterium]
MPTEPTRWARLEPTSRDRELAPGLEARVHDPLWLLGRQWQFGELAAAERQALIAPIPLGRPGDPRDVAWAVRFLASDEAAYVSGATLEVSGAG